MGGGSDTASRTADRHDSRLPLVSCDALSLSRAQRRWQSPGWSVPA